MVKVTPSILQHEFIGLKAKVARSTNRGCIGISGRVLNETRNTFTILHKARAKIVVKETSAFHFTLADGTLIEVDGKALVGQPEDRVKAATRRRW